MLLMLGPSFGLSLLACLGLGLLCPPQMAFVGAKRLRAITMSFTRSLRRRVEINYSADSGCQGRWNLLFTVTSSLPRDARSAKRGITIVSRPSVCVSVRP